MAPVASASGSWLVPVGPGSAAGPVVVVVAVVAGVVVVAPELGFEGEPEQQQIVQTLATHVDC